MTAQGVSELLMGAPGSGKTHALRTLVDAGVEPFIIFTDNGMEVMRDTRVASDAYRDALKNKRVHWKYIPPAKPSWASLRTAFRSGQSMDIGTLQKQTAIDKMDYGQFGTLLDTLENFKCDVCGEEHGNVDDWDTSRVLVIDGLSGINTMLLGWASGSKAAITQPEWGMAMKMEEGIVQRLTLGTVCHFVLVAHLDRQIDMLSGGVKLMPGALGNKLPPNIGKTFSDIILAERAEGATFQWNLGKIDADVKARNISWESKQQPSFVPIFNHWRKANEVA